MTASFRIRVFMCIIDSLDPVFLGPFECSQWGLHLRLPNACFKSLQTELPRTCNFVQREGEFKRF
jgi:hypothetical protein